MNFKITLLFITILPVTYFNGAGNGLRHFPLVGIKKYHYFSVDTTIMYIVGRVHSHFKSSKF